MLGYPEPESRLEVNLLWNRCDGPVYGARGNAGCGLLCTSCLLAALSLLLITRLRLIQTAFQVIDHPDRQAMTKVTPAAPWPDSSSSPPKSKTSGDRFGPQKCGSAAENTATNGLLSDGQPQHAPPTPGGHHDLTLLSGVGKTGAARWEIAAPTMRAGGQGPS